MNRPAHGFPFANSATCGLVAFVSPLLRALAVLVLATGLAMAEDAYVEGEVLVTFKSTVDARASAIPA